MVQMKEIYLFTLSLSVLASAMSREIFIDSDADCWITDQSYSMEKSYTTSVKFSSKVAYGQANCSVELANPWVIDNQYGLSVLFPRSMDCGSTVTVQCLTENLRSNESFPLSQRFTCESIEKFIVMPCSAIRLTYKRDLISNSVKKTTFVHVVSLAKGPCSPKRTFFSCFRDYPNACIDAKLKCNGIDECPNGDDEQNCPNSPSTGTTIIFIVQFVLALLFFICISSSILICCCCRAAINRIIQRFRSDKSNGTCQKTNDVTVIGEDASLMKSLTATDATVEVVETSNYRSEPEALKIDSTKPIYPRLE